MSLKIILTSVCLCSLTALCLQGVVLRASPTELGVHAGQSAAPLCPAGFSVPHLCQPWSQHLSLLPLPCTFLHNSGLDYTPNLVQEWWKVQSSKGDNGLFQLESPSRGLGKVYVALTTAATGCQRPLEQTIF